ncbi:MAG: hypothetical protein AB7K04_07125 [Pseudorhodoplanes sp.]
MDLILRILTILLGLLVAIAAAGFTIALGMFLPEWGTMETDPVDRAAFFIVAFFATSFAGAAAYVPALLAVAVAEALSLRSFLYYGLAGAAIALLGYFGSNISARLEDTTEITPVAHSLELVVAAGIVGGLVYWLLVGRNAGRWRAARV